MTGPVPRFDTHFAVQFDEVDMYGIVHHARYVVYMERGRLDAFVRIGFGPSQEATLAHGLVVGSVEVTYRRPSRLLDPLRVETWCERIKGPVVVLRNRILCGDELRARGLVRLVHTGAEGVPARVPDEIRAALMDPDLPSADAVVAEPAVWPRG